MRFIYTVLLLVLCGCASQIPLPADPIIEKIPLSIMPLTEAGFYKVETNEALALSQSLFPLSTEQLANLDFALTQSLNFNNTKPANQIVPAYAKLNITYGQLSQSIAKLIGLLPAINNNPEILTTAFIWYRYGPDFGFTGYYEPELQASPVPTPRFKYPLYKRPPDLGKKKPYHTRHAIDRKKALANRNLELAWMEDQVEIFFLQIQGSGRLRYPDGSLKYALYSGQNGRRYVSLGRVMLDKGIMEREEISMTSLKNWLRENPDQQNKMLDTNPSYVFFKLGEHGSYGSMGRILTPYYSIAADQKVLPNGTLSLVHLNLTTTNGTKPWTSLVLTQDSGGAIRKNRIDLFCGHGQEAEYIASNLNTKGAVYILMPK